MFYHRGFCHDVEALHFKVVALCALFCLSTFGPCTMTGTQNPMSYDEYGSYRNDLGSGSEDVLVGDGRKRIGSQSSISKLSLENICRRSDLFCFPSTLSGFFSDFHSAEANVSVFPGVKAAETVVVESTQPTDNLSWSSDHGNFRLLSGSVVSCSLELKEGASDQKDTPSCRGSSLDRKTPRVNQKEESVIIQSRPVDDFSSLHVQISHPLLDWGRNYLHFPSLAFLTVENRHNHSVLNVFEPYSTNAQFYPCNYSEIELGPGEVASICFVFLPKWLGLSSAHLILQTSSGGFLIQAQGFAVESPHVIQQSVGLNYSSSGRSSNVVSLFNPSDKVLHLKEVSARISFSSGSVSYSVKAVCSMKDHEGSSEFSVKEWLDVRISQVGQPVMALRPQKTWTVVSNSIEPILELEFPYRPQANIFGFLCVELLTASRDNLDTIILEAEIGGRSGSYDLKTHLSVSVDVLMPCDANGTTSVSLLLENDSPDLLMVVKISAVGENRASLQTKYVEGLMLFPHTVTQVAMITYTPDLDMSLNCKLLLETNKSDAPKLEISCSDIASLCSRLHSYPGYGRYREMLNYENAETRSSNVHVQATMEIKATEMTKADESVLGNWRSQGTENGMSVLDEDEVVFPVVHIGTHQSKWISVVNPSDQPVVMQLLLNSGEIINGCRGSDEILQSFASSTLVLNGHLTCSRYGFSVARNALTEAYVHPHGKAVLGPIIFHPSSRCVWRSSALVRNNLSGVEWLSLSGSGGLLSLVLFDDRSDPVHNIKLKHNFPSLYNRGYGQPSTKLVFAKNTGDLPLEVIRISVSGTKCELDGFAVDTCKGFTLQPGESRKLTISYRAEFCAGMVRRDLEIAMSGGILIIPMEVSLPTPMLTICRRSLLWARFKKFFLAVFVSIFLISMACSCSFSFTIRGENLSKSSSEHEEIFSDMWSKQKPVSSLPETGKEVAKCTVIEASKPENLTVKTGKEKARRRKKKKGSGAGLTSQFEASSSHSSNSNSTPSSPLSPVSSFLSKRPLELSPKIRTRNHLKHSVVCSTEDKPSTLSSTLAPAKTTAARWSRAPGAERKAVKAEPSSGSGAIFMYNIWDDHLCSGLLGSSEVASVPPIMAEGGNFSSFFAASPRKFFTTSRAEETVSFKQYD